ncbi:hypothetical protein DI383_14065 [Flavobacteriaceae bacterium LYZ1037]|nr:hypothetical protein DI383_14065 [Flavobacteriaceae bacterium LYZ1037]
MNWLLKSVSLIFHPILMPLLGVLFYFSKSPRFIPIEIIQAKIISLLILTIALPILLYFLLKNIGRVNSIYLNTTKERLIPLFLNGCITLLIINRVLPPTEIIELYYFFVGILISTLACFILAILKFKASIHMIGIAGVTMFYIALSIHFSINVNGTLALMFILIGAIATSRLHVKAHSNIELLIGFFIGLVPQLILVNYWL